MSPAPHTHLGLEAPESFTDRKNMGDAPRDVNGAEWLTEQLCLAASAAAEGQCEPLPAPSYYHSTFDLYSTMRTMCERHWLVDEAASKNGQFIYASRACSDPTSALQRASPPFRFVCTSRKLVQMLT